MPTFKFFLVIFTFGAVYARFYADTVCKILLEEVSDDSPLYLHPNQTELIPDKKNSTAVVSLGEVIIFACYSPGNKVRGYSTKSVEGVCVGRDMFKTRKGIYPAMSINCVRPVYPVTVNKGSCNGPQKGQMLDIGYQGEGNVFILGLTLCHIKDIGETVWVQYKTNQQIYRLRTKGINKQDLKIGQVVDFYSRIQQNISDLYKTARHRLPIPFYSDSLQASMLAPPEDFVSYNMQKVTYYYLNTIPRWSSTLSGAWYTIDQGIHNKYKEFNKPLTVLVGTYEMTTVDDTEMWLSNKMIPLPKYVWKVVIRANKSIVFAIENVQRAKRKWYPPAPFSDGENCMRRGWEFKRYSDRISCGSFKKLVSTIGEKNLPKSIIDILNMN